ncbi:MAG: ParA family protein, partial [Clostridia bacterium]|nr:ParA family protein [Clostridia bacterium]
GGVGKTTTTINLSSFVALFGFKVLVVDIDPQGNTTSGFGIAGEKKDNLKNTIYEVMMGDATVKETVCKTTIPNLDVVPATMDFAGADSELMELAESREKVLRKALSSVRGDYDYIFIDCPPSLNIFSVNALTASDGVLIPMPGDFFSLEGIGQLMNTVKLVKKHRNPGLEIEGVFMTIYDGRSNLANQVAAEVSRWFGKSVFKTRIPRNVRLGEAPSHGLPVIQYEPNSKGSVAYMELAVEMLRRHGHDVKPLTGLSKYKYRAPAETKKVVKKTDGEKKTASKE